MKEKGIKIAVTLLLLPAAILQIAGLATLGWIDYTCAKSGMEVHLGLWKFCFKNHTSNDVNGSWVEDVNTTCISTYETLPTWPQGNAQNGQVETVQALEGIGIVVCLVALIAHLTTLGNKPRNVVIAVIMGGLFSGISIVTGVGIFANQYKGKYNDYVIAHHYGYSLYLAVVAGILAFIGGFVAFFSPPVEPRRKTKNPAEFKKIPTEVS